MVVNNVNRNRREASSTRRPRGSSARCSDCPPTVNFVMGIGILQQEYDKVSECNSVIDESRLSRTYKTVPIPTPTFISLTFAASRTSQYLPAAGFPPTSNLKYPCSYEDLEREFSVLPSSQLNAFSFTS